MSRASPGAVCGGVVDERRELGVAVSVEVSDHRGVGAGRHLHALGLDRGVGTGRVVAVGEDLEVIAAGRDLERVGEGARLEVGDQLVAVGVDVDGETGHGVQDRDGGILGLGGVRGHGGQGECQQAGGAGHCEVSSHRVDPFLGDLLPPAGSDPPAGQIAVAARKFNIFLHSLFTDGSGPRTSLKPVTLTAARSTASRNRW